MEWLPKTIDSLTGLAREIGGFYLLLIMPIIALCIILYRHSSSLVKAVEQMVANHQEAIEVQKESVEVQKTEVQSRSLATGELFKQTALLEGLQPTMAKIANWPSDLPGKDDMVCKYRPSVEEVKVEAARIAEAAKITPRPA